MPVVGPVVGMVGRTIAEIREQWGSFTKGVEDRLFVEKTEQGNTFYTLDVLICSACSEPVAQWSEWEEETGQNKAKQIENFPLNQAALCYVWECGECQSRTWDSDEAEECCL